MLSDRLTSVCLFVACIGYKSRTERPRKTKIGTEVAHVTRDSGITLNKGQRSPGLFTHRGVNASGSCSGENDDWPWEPTSTLRSAGAVGSAARGASASTEGGEGRGHIVAAPAQLVQIDIAYTVRRKGLLLPTGHTLFSS